jgi:hypothetical protein
MSKRSRATAGSVALDAGLRALELEAGEEVRLRVADVRVCLGDEALGAGTLYVTTERVAWLRAAGAGAGAGAGADAGVSVRYPVISLHAVCRDPDAFPEPCVFCQLDAPLRRGTLRGAGAAVLHVEGAGAAGAEAGAAAFPLAAGLRGAAAGLAPLGFAGGAAEDAAAAAAADPEEAAVRARLAGSARAGAFAFAEEEGEEAGAASEGAAFSSDELRFIPPPEAAFVAAAVAGEPASVGVLDAIFNAMSECAQLHPDGGEDEDEDKGAGEGVDDGGEGLMAAVMSGATGFVGGAGGGALTAQQAKTLARYEAMLGAGGAGGGQFDDADEDGVAGS